MIIVADTHTYRVVLIHQYNFSEEDKIRHKDTSSMRKESFISPLLLANFIC